MAMACLHNLMLTHDEVCKFSKINNYDVTPALWIEFTITCIFSQIFPYVHSSFTEMFFVS